jgi:hypothetical protein
MPSSSATNALDVNGAAVNGTSALNLDAEAFFATELTDDVLVLHDASRCVRNHAALSMASLDTTWHSLAIPPHKPRTPLYMQR